MKEAAAWDDKVLSLSRALSLFLQSNGDLSAAFVEICYNFCVCLYYVDGRCKIAMRVRLFVVVSMPVFVLVSLLASMFHIHFSLCSGCRDAGRHASVLPIGNHNNHKLGVALSSFRGPVSTDEQPARDLDIEIAYRYASSVSAIGQGRRSLSSIRHNVGSRLSLKV